MSFFPVHMLGSLVHAYGYPIIFIGIMLESLGLPLPGESLMIGAAVYAATAHNLNIFILVPVAAAGAIAGDQCGYFIGRWIGQRVLTRWGKKIGLSDERINLSRFLFRRYGGGVVFLGRFVAILRTFAAVLAGANRMPWHSFLLWNSLGGVTWTCLYSFGAYALGDAAKRLHGPIGIAMAIIGAAALLGAIIFVKHNQARLLDEARQQMSAPDASRLEHV